MKMRKQKASLKNNELPIIINNETETTTIFNKERKKICVIPNVDSEVRKQYIEKFLSNYNLYTRPIVIQTI